MSYDDSLRPLPTVDVIETLNACVEQAADRRDLSGRLRQIYGTWIFGFVCWCLRKPPNRVTADRIESFRRTLTEDSESDLTDEQQALDALAFFFGEVDIDSLGVQTSGGRSMETSTTSMEEFEPFVYYNQVDPPESSPLSPVQDPLAKSERSLTDSLMPDAKRSEGVEKKVQHVESGRSN